METIKFIKFQNFYWDYLLSNKTFDISKKSIRTKILRFFVKFSFFVVLWNLLLYGLVNASNLFISPFIIDRSFMELSFIATILKILVTYGCIYWNQEKLKKIMAIFPERFTLDETNKHKIDKKLMWIKIFVKGALYQFSSSFILLIGEPIKEYLVNNKRIFPFHIIFPFNTDPCYVYFPLFLWIIISHALHIILMVGNYNILYGFVTLLSIEFNKLKEQFRELKEFETKQLAENLKNCINRQNELIEAVEQFQKIFSPTLFIKFILSSFLICASAFQCSTAENLLGLLFHLIFCVFALNQVFILCFFGQMLKDASQGVADGIYSSGWENLKDIKLRFSILMALREAQKNSKLTVFNVSTISLNQFKKVNLLIFQFWKYFKNFIDHDFVDFEDSIFILHTLSTCLSKKLSIN